MKPAENEIWKDLIGYEGLYKISNFGNILLLERKAWTWNGGRTLKSKILKPTLGRGYYLIGLMKNHVRKYYLIHRLIAINFIPNPENKPEINHIDGNKKNNKIDNLEWVTRQENAIHAHKTGLQVNPTLGSSCMAKKVIDTKTGKEYPCLKSAATELSIPYPRLKNWMNGHCKNKSNLQYA